MMARMRAKWETEVLIHISFSSPNNWIIGFMLNDISHKKLLYEILHTSLLISCRILFYEIFHHKICLQSIVHKISHGLIINFERRQLRRRGK